MFAEMLAIEAMKNGTDGWRSRASNAAMEFAEIVEAENLAAGLTPLHPPADLLDKVYTQMRRAVRHYRSRPSGQTVTEYDNPDYLMVMAAWQIFVGLNSELPCNNNAGELCR